MHNIILITKREYLTQVKKKSFVILTLFAPLLLIGFGVLISFMFKANQSEAVVQVVDNSGLFISELKSDDKISYQFISEIPKDKLSSELKNKEDITGILLFPKIENNDFEAFQKNTTLWIEDKIGFDAKQKINADVTEIIRKEKIKRLGLRPEQMQDIEKDFSIRIESIHPENHTDTDLEFSVKSGLSMFLMYITFMFIMMYGVRVMRSVLEEKNNRVVEIIISSVKPFELMMGKILGVTLVALTQFSVWIAMTIVGAIFFDTSFSMMKTSTPQHIENVEIEQYIVEISHILLELNAVAIILVFILFFLLGYLFYSSLYAAIGSAVDNETETQQFTLFAIIPLMVGMYGSFSFINNPDGPMAFWLSIIPLTSPVAMVARIPYGVPFWQVLLSFTLLLGSTLFVVFLAGKIYRVGILMYGNKITLKELWKWVRS